MMTVLFAATAALSVNFDQDIGAVRPELHSSGFGPQICSCPQEYINDIKAMGFKASRTHDWALLNPNDRVCDYHHIFPLIHLDAKDPKNYVFAQTDYLLKRTRELLGHDIFFRLGTSIEHSGSKVHFNSLIPEDFDKVAEVFAGTVRHYNKGWANGHAWNIKYWEIWNEPDGCNNMWCLPEGDEDWTAVTPEDKAKKQKRRDLFVKFFVTCLKRIKSEFPDVKVGGPAMCSMSDWYFRALLKACKDEGIAPDFISWHHYVENPIDMMWATQQARRLCDEFGFKDCELIINEWHYFSYSDYDWGKLRSADPQVVRKVWSGPRSHNGIDSSCFNLAALSLAQTSKLSQFYYYGCRNIGSWGYMDFFKQKYKVFSGLCLFGDFVKSYKRLCAAKGSDPNGAPIVTVLGGKSTDGKKRAVLVSDYRVRTNELVVAVQGVPAGAKVTARVHDYTHDLAPADFTFANGQLTLRKCDDESAAFLVEFE